MEDPVVEKGWSQLVIAGIVTLAVLTIALFSRRKSYPLPPGSRGWPVLGSLLSLEKLFHRSLVKISDKYGPIVYFHLGCCSRPRKWPKRFLKYMTRQWPLVQTLQWLASFRSYHPNDVEWSPLEEYWRTVRKICTQELFSPARVNQFQIGGYDIPAKTKIMVNVFAIQRDPSVYKDALAFKSERFLNSSKDVQGLDYDLLPFGSGRRICPAMNLGLLTVQYVVAQLLPTITWSLPPGQKLT